MNKMHTVVMFSITKRLSSLYQLAINQETYNIVRAQNRSRERGRRVISYAKGRMVHGS